MESSSQKIKQAREAYFDKHPFDPHEKVLMGYGDDGMPTGFLTLPDMGELQIVATKFGMEYLAICDDKEAVDDWVLNVSTTTGNSDLSGIMFAHIFRGIDGIISQIIDRDPGLRDVLTGIAVDGWEKSFKKLAEEEADEQ